MFYISCTLHLSKSIVRFCLTEVNHPKILPRNIKPILSNLQLSLCLRHKDENAYHVHVVVIKPTEDEENVLTKNIRNLMSTNMSGQPMKYPVTW